MKQLFAILFAFLIGSQQTIAQGSKKLESFRETVLPEYSMYFKQAGVTENGQLNLSATETYNGLSADAKKEIMISITNAWRESLILVQVGSKREVWGRSDESGSTQLLDEFDLSSPPLSVMAKIDSRPHPWFFYVGGQLGADNQHDINVAVNLRLGFFLLKNRWDLATTFSGGLTGYLNTSYNSGAPSTAQGWGNVGLMSRVHFPIKNLGLSPNIGGECTVALNGNTTPTVNAAIVLGISWYIGFGSLDIGISLGNVVSGSGGYTMSPQIRRNK